MRNTNNRDPRTLDAPRVVLNPANAAAIITAPFTVGLVLLPSTRPEIATTIVQCVVITMIGFKSLGRLCDKPMQPKVLSTPLYDDLRNHIRAFATATKTYVPTIPKRDRQIRNADTRTKALRQGQRYDSTRDERLDARLSAVVRWGANRTNGAEMDIEDKAIIADMQAQIHVMHSLLINLTRHYVTSQTAEMVEPTM